MFPRLISILTFALALIALIAGCATPTPTPEHMVHQARHGGELQMTADFHVEVVSERPGEYKIYLYDPTGKPIPPEGNRVEVALVDSAGKIVSVFPARLVSGVEYFIASGGPTNVPKTDLRLTIYLKGKPATEVNLTIQNKLVSPPTLTLPIVITTPTSAPVALPAAPVAPGRLPAVHWSVTQSGIVAKMYLNPFPFKLGAMTTFQLLLTESDVQALTDAKVNLTITGGMAGMAGEHDEDFHLVMASQGSGLYVIRASPGTSNLEFGGMNLSIQKGTRTWSFAISKDELGIR